MERDNIAYFLVSTSAPILLYIVTTRHLTSFEFRDTHALPTEGGNGMENFKRGTACAAISAPPCFINWGGGDVMFEFFYKSGNLSCLFVYLFVVVSFVPEEIHWARKRFEIVCANQDIYLYFCSFFLFYLSFKSKAIWTLKNYVNIMQYLMTMITRFEYNNEKS